MSLNEKKRDKQLPDIFLLEGICRSKSFAGLSHRRSSSTDVTVSSAHFNFDAFSAGSLQNGAGILNYIHFLPCQWFPNFFFLSC